MLKQNLVRNLNAPASPSHAQRRYSGQTPKKPSSPTIEQLLNNDATRWSAANLPTSPALRRDYDPEEDHTPNLHKKSVLAKVKQKAKRWRQNLGKKKRSQDGISTPSWGVSLHEDNNDRPDGDPEYLGAPMYESEMAPEVLKETTSQHPRAAPVITQTHALPCNTSEETICKEKENPPNSPKQKANEEKKDSVTSPSKTLTESVTAKLAPAYESVTEKLAPAYATISEKTQNIATKIQGLAVSTHSEQQGLSDHTDQQKYDKGVSVKEYLYQKFEPGEDEKALSKVITEAIISPKKSPDGKGVLEKVREAVSLLLRTDDATPPSTNTTSASSTITTLTTSTHSTSPALSTISTVECNPSNSTDNYPASSYVLEGMEEESQGRILQAN